MTLIARSRFVALLVGAFVTYANLAGDYDGAITVLGVYLITYFVYGRKQKSTSAGDTDAHHNI